MRVTEYIHYLNRTDTALGKNISNYDYTHITIRMVHKRQRYQYQLQRRKDERNKKRLAKNS